MAQKDVETIQSLLHFAYIDLATLEDQWLSIENKLIAQLEQTTNDFLKQKLLDEYQDRQETIEQEIEEVEQLIEQLKQEKNLLLNPPPPPILELEPEEPEQEEEVVEEVEEAEEVVEIVEVVEEKTPQVSKIRREILDKQVIINRLRQELSRARTNCPSTDPCAQPRPCPQRTDEISSDRTQHKRKQDPRFRCSREEPQPIERAFSIAPPTSNPRRRLNPLITCAPPPPPEGPLCPPPGAFRSDMFRSPAREEE